MKFYLHFISPLNSRAFHLLASIETDLKVRESR